jgi:uncharacterized membrane protein YdjX (TVP38/TMEM64 family)
MLNDFIHLIEFIKGTPLALPVFFVMFVAACHVAPVSLFPVAGGVLFGFKGGLLINMAAILVGATGPFFISRWLGQHRFNRIFSRWHNRDMAALLRNPSPWGLVVIRLVGLPPFVVTNYLVGLSHMRYRQFLWSTAVGVLPSLLVITLSSDSLWKILTEAGMGGFRQAMMKHGLPLLLGGGFMASLMAAGLLMNRRARKKSASKTENQIGS